MGETKIEKKADVLKEKDILIARLEAELLLKDQTILNLQQDRLQANAVAIEENLRKLLKPSEKAVFNWQTKTFVEPPPEADKKG